MSRVVVVTCATSGVGRAAAREFAGRAVAPHDGVVSPRTRPARRCAADGAARRRRR
ncbi:hypothetical protein [Micromonospora sp. HUAS LYJ1]|uniref:hypothetical protein n=1 Tax=Micromonospora sp. HUAS LYJ1 TaxID=3061626 RepID=UPI0026741DFB|nr:hypothetical protein [Micromonospora sp. HUAS LYJ1]WKU05092.1 hypothetical protein Q2K16_30775 [Micromonospora sp. HUAS LYJ1]